MKMKNTIIPIRKRNIFGRNFFLAPVTKETAKFITVEIEDGVEVRVSKAKRQSLTGGVTDWVEITLCPRDFPEIFSTATGKLAIESTSKTVFQIELD